MDIGGLNGSLAEHLPHPVTGRRVAHRLAKSATPARWSPALAAGLGALAAAGVGYLTSRNPAAGPAGAAVPLRVITITLLLAAGIYARTRDTQAKMGSLLIAAGIYSALWFLNGSANRFGFSLGVLVTGLAPAVPCYLALAHPEGWIRSPRERGFLLLAAGLTAALWTAGVLISAQPPMRTPLLRCLPHCPTGVFHLGTPALGAIPALSVSLRVGWAVLTCGTAVLVVRRALGASPPVRRAIGPVALVSVAAAVSLVAYFASPAVWPSGTDVLAAAYVSSLAALAFAVFVGLGLERMFMGQALARLVSHLARDRGADPEVLIAAALEDPTLRIAYLRPAAGTYVDAAGLAVSPPGPGPDRAVIWIDRDRLPVAAVTYDPQLANQERFIQAAGAAAMLRLEQTQAEADLIASNAELVASRLRLVESAQAERRRIERDLHDGVQQDLVALRVKLDLAAEVVGHESGPGAEMLEAIGRQMDVVLESVRSLARGIYPSLLQDRGLAPALKSIARRSAPLVSVRGGGIGRYAQDTEVAVYFCCLEALQNVAKHGGPAARASIHLWEEDGALRFEVADSGVGFDPAAAAAVDGNGLTNMRDRIEAVGGTLTVNSAVDRGTRVGGRVPV